MRRFVRLSQFALATLMGSGVYYVNKHKISLTNPFLDALLSTC